MESTGCGARVETTSGADGAAAKEGLLEENRRLAAAVRLQNDVLSTASHELRTPLNAIVGFTELLHDGKLGPVAPEQREYLADILSSARHLLRLLGDVLDMARMDAGRMEFHRDEVPIAAAAREVRDLLRGQAARKRVRVDLDLPPDASRGFLDRARLLQVLYNFLAYAIRATPADGAVRVVLAVEPEGAVRVEVRDGAPPIHADVAAGLFDGFLPEGDDDGRTLGLALSRRLVEAQGGSVGIRVAPEGGNVVHAILPPARAS